ncbi:MAG: hypothetical protein JSS81_10475 [Acidobacteria bacterium]|nr:hypothetical protein [Acidobacteriota bacterium]
MRLFLLVFLLSAGPGAGQYRFDSWTIDDGLPQNSVRGIAQTRDGYLWLVTLDGLVRFDGLRFTVFDKSTHPELVTTRFRSIFAAADGALLIATENNGLLRFDGRRFETFTTAAGLPSDYALRIYAESDDRIAVQTRDGLAYLKDGKISAPDDNRPENERLVYYAAASGNRWKIDLPDRLTLEAAGQTSVRTLPFTVKFMNQVRAYEDRNGALWISESGRLWRYFRGEFRSFERKDGFAGYPSCFLEDRDGTLWIGTTDAGIYLYRNESFKNLTVDDGLSSNFIGALFEDREGTLWVGTNNRGLARIQKQLIRTISARDGLRGANVYPILSDRRGRTWVGAQDGPLNLIENGKFRQFDFYGARSFAEDAAGAIWIFGQDDLRIFRDGRLVPVTDIPAALKSNFVFAVQTDRAGALWFSTVAGLFRLQNGVWTHFGKADGLPADEVRFVHETARGEFYVGTYDGLVRFDRDSPADRRFRVFTTADGLASDHLRTIYEEPDGTLWIGTYDGGLTRFRDGRLTSFTTADGLYSNGVFAILEDARGNFWMSSNQGIHRVAKSELNDFADGRLKKLTGVGYGKRDGMLNAECNGDRQPSSAKMPDGTLWFPTQDGIAVVDPKLLTFNELPPPVVIEAALVNREKAAPENEIRLDQNRDNLEIRFTAPSFIRSGQIRFRYRLEGLDDDWIDAGTRRDAYFSYLPAGRYRFRVTAANSDGVWNETGALLEIVVVPPFYKTWWFAALAALAAAGFVGLLYQTRVRRFRREKNLAEDFSNRLIESQEQERKRIAAELHDGLSQSLVIIKNRAELCLGDPQNTEFTTEHLEEISVTATEAIDEAKEIIHDLRPIQLDRLGLTKAVAAMLRRVSETAGIEFETALEPIDELLPKPAESSLYRIVQEAVNNLVRHSGAARARVEISKTGAALRIVVTDDGRGFDETAARPANGGFGLAGIRERARLLNGEALIESKINFGTSVKITIPLSR